MATGLGALHLNPNTSSSSTTTTTCSSGALPLLQQLMAPLRRMTELQASFDPALQARREGGGFVAPSSKVRLGQGKDKGQQRRQQWQRQQQQQQQE